MKLKAEIIRDAENIRCLVNIEELTIEQIALLAQDIINSAHRYLGKGNYHCAHRVLEMAVGYADLCLRAQNQEEIWIESLPDEDAA